MNNIYESYYNSSLENMRAVYIGMINDCPEIITEASSDLLNTAVDFIERINLATDKIVAYKLRNINKTLDSLKNESKRISSLLETNKIAFRVEGYEYTISDDIPNVTYINTLIDNIKDDLYGTDFSIEKTKTLRDKIIYSDYLDRVRAKIIKEKNPVESGDFTDTIIPKFRDGERSPIELTIDNDYLEKMIKNVQEFHKSLNMAIKQKERITDLMKKYKSLFKGGNDSWYAKHANKCQDFSQYKEWNKALNDYCQLRCKEAVAILNAVTLAYTEKFDAIAEATDLYSYIFKTALSSCNEVK